MWLWSEQVIRDKWLWSAQVSRDSVTVIWASEQGQVWLWSEHMSRDSVTVIWANEQRQCNIDLSKWAGTVWLCSKQVSKGVAQLVCARSGGLPVILWAIAFCVSLLDHNCCQQRLAYLYHVFEELLTTGWSSVAMAWARIRNVRCSACLCRIWRGVTARRSSKVMTRELRMREVTRGVCVCVCVFVCARAC
jgi:hypothetical protein